MKLFGYKEKMYYICIMGIVIGRHQEGISLNPIEYLLEGADTDRVKVFADKETAYAFLRKNIYEEVTDEDLEDSFVFLDTEKDFDDPEQFNYSE